MDGKRIHFDEFKLFYDSTEKVTDRRLSANKWNYTICTAILFAIGVITNWAVSSPKFLLPSILIILILSFMAVMYCTFWIAQIRDFKQLNNAKFNVLNKMAPYVSFGEMSDDSRVSYRPFEKEWDALQEAEAIQKSANSNLITLKSSNMEYLIPKSFRFLYIFIMVIVLFLSVYNSEKIFSWDDYKVTQKTIKKK